MCMRTHYTFTIRTQGRGASRALRDGNWRSPTTPDDEPAPGWANQRQQQPPPSPATGVLPRNAWGKKDPAATPTGQTGQTGSGRWGHPASLPEWARDDMTTTSVGTFDSAGTFTSSGEKSGVEDDDGKPASSKSTNKQSVEDEASVVDNQPTQKQLKTTAQNESHDREGLVSDKHPVASPHPSPLTDSSHHSHPHKSHSLGNRPVAARVFPVATDPLPLSSSSAMSSRHVVRPLTLSAVSLPPPVTSATPAETPPSVIGPTTHLASGDVAMSRDNHVISHRVSHARGKERLFSPSSAEDDQMRQIEKATEALLYTEEEMTPSPGPTPQPPPTTSSVLTPSSAHATPSPAAPPQKPTQPSSSGPTSTVVGAEELNKWLYKDPQGAIQGPFPAADMREWFNAGYFTMELMIKRACDSVMLPLGQMIRIWGRIPFQPTSHAPPPIRPEEPFWKRLFQQQFIVQQQQQQIQQHKQQQQQIQQQQELLQQQQRRVNQQPLPAAKEEQWPDITGGESLWETPLTRPPPPSSSVITPNTQLIQQQKKAEEEVRRIGEEREREEKMRRESEERKRAEEERRRQVARKQREEEEAKQRVREQERERQEQMKREQKERARQEQLRAEQERVARQQEKMRKEQERARLEQMRREEEKKKGEEQEKLRLAKEQQRKQELYLQQQGLQQQQQQQQLIEQQQELQKKQQLEHQQRQLRLQREQEVQRSTQQPPGLLPWVPQTTPTSQQAPSLLQIQQEEESQAKEMRNREEQMRAQHMKLFQQPQQQPQLGWGKSSITKPKSLVEIQQEQQTDPRELTTPTSAGGHGIKGKPYFTFGIPSSPNPPPNFQNWSSLAGKKAPPTSWGGGQPHPHNEVAMTSSNLKGGSRPQFKIADDELDEVSFWDDCAREVKNSRSHGNQGGSHGNQSGSHGNQSGPSWGEGVAPKKKDREEENIRRLFSVNSATEEFNQWCDRELKKFSTDVDAQTFVSFLLEVDSVYEVHDYIKSYLGETDEAHEFAKSFLDRRQKIKSTNNPPPASQGKKSRPKNNSSANAELSPADPIKMGGASGVGGVASSSEGSGGGGGTSRSSKKKKKKMQKVNPAALLGFTVNAGERPNMGGEIQSAKDAV